MFYGKIEGIEDIVSLEGKSADGLSQHLMKRSIIIRSYAGRIKRS